MNMQMTDQSFDIPEFSPEMVELDSVYELDPLIDRYPEIVDKLMAPFPLGSHAIHAYHKFVYLKEFAISTRLTTVLGVGNWSKKIVSVQHFPAGPPYIKRGSDFVPATPTSTDGELATMPQGVQYDKPSVVVIGEMTVRFPDGTEATRSSVGGDSEVALGKEPATRLVNTIKAADTDLLKRLARQFGVGLYLTELSTASVPVNSIETLRIWLNERYPDDIRFWQINDASEFLLQRLSGAFPDVYPDPESIIAIKNELEMPSGQGFLDNFYRIEAGLVRYAQEVQNG